MTSKNSFLVRQRENARRRQWLWIINSLVLLFVMPVRYLASCSVMHRGYESVSNKEFIENLSKDLFMNLGPSFVLLPIIAVSAILAAMQGYSYLYHSKKVDMYHSQPVTCRSRFFSIYINGILTFLCPYFINAILTLAVGFNYHIVSMKFLMSLLLFTGTNFLCYVAIYNTAILGVTMTGNLLAGSCGIAALLGTEWGLRKLFYCYSLDYFHTFSNFAKNEVMKPTLSVATIYLQGARTAYVDGVQDVGPLWNDIGNCTIRMTIIGAFTLLLAYYVYKYRPAEAAGHSVAFGWMKPIVKIAAMTLGSLTLGLVLASLSGKNTWIVLFGIAIGVILAHCVFEIVLELRFGAVFHKLWNILIGEVIVGVIFSFFLFDITDYDTKIPEEENIQSTMISFSAQETEGTTFRSDGLSVIQNLEKTMFYTDVDAVMRLAAADYYHQTGEKELKDQQNQYSQVTVLYRMKNGDNKYRSYYIDMAAQEDVMNRILESDEYKSAIFPVTDENYMKDVSNYSMTFDSFLLSDSIDKEDHNAILDSLREDMKNYSYSILKDEAAIGTISLNGNDDHNNYWSDSYVIYPSYHNVIDVLQKEKYYDSSLNINDEINKIEVEYYPESEYNGQGEHVEYTDKAKMDEILSHSIISTYGLWWKEQTKLYNDIYIFVYTNRGSVQAVTLKKGDKIPEWLLKDIKYDDTKPHYVSPSVG